MIGYNRRRLLVFGVAVICLLGCQAKPTVADVQMGADIEDTSYIETSLREHGYTLDTIRKKAAAVYAATDKELSKEDALLLIKEKFNPLLQDRYQNDKSLQRMRISYVPAENWYFVTVYTDGVLGGGQEAIVHAANGEVLYSWGTE